jgi:group I intron endonuclease
MKISEIGFIYMITSPTGRIYVGSTIDIDYRFSQYKRLQCKNQIKLYNSLIKHGFEKHNFEVIWAGLLKNMLKYEALIGFGFDVLESHNLNLQLPKLNDDYKSVSNETRQKIGNANRGRILSNEHKEILRKANLGSKRNLGRTRSSVSKLKMRNNNLGKILSEETKQKQSKANQKVILQYDLNMVFIKEWSGAQEINNILKINRVSIGKCCRLHKNNKTAGNYIWRYKQKIK